MANTIPAPDGDWEAFELFGRKALFSNYRIDRDSVPDGLYAYDLRDADDLSGTPSEVKSVVTVNHMGTVVTGRPIENADVGVEISETDYNFVGFEMDIGEFADWMRSLEGDDQKEEWPDA